MRCVGVRVRVAILVLVAGCRFDLPEPQVVDDARADGNTGIPFKGYNANEGGEVRIEYVRFGSGTAATRAGAFFYDNPGSTKFWPFTNLRGCQDTSDDKVWPMAASPIAERTYLDPGKVIIAGGPQLLQLPRRTAETRDVSGRVHPANALFLHFGGGTAVDGPTFLAEKARYDVIVTGSANMPAQVFSDVLFMPGDYQVIDPPLSTAPTPIQAGTPKTFLWQTVNEGAPQGYEVQSLVAFTTPTTGPVVTCVEPNDGEITVPANLIDVARAKLPSGGTLLRQTLTHVVRELVDNNGPTGKRIDFIMAWSYATPFSVP